MNFKAFIMIILTLIIVGTIPTIFKMVESIRPSVHTPMINYCPLWMSTIDRNDYNKVVSDLNLIRELGFRGVRLWHIDGEGVQSWDHYGFTARVVDDILQRDLFLYISLRPWKQWQFPDNATAISEYKDFLNKVIREIRGKGISAYTLHYPINFGNKAETKKKVVTAKYRTELQGIINLIHSIDPDAKIYMSEDFDPTEFNVPLDLNYISGFGVCPYSWYVSDTMDSFRIDSYLNFFKQKGLKVEIHEWGIQTNEAWIPLGRATSESNKARMIEEFIHYLRTRNIVWGYFSLHDTSESDWGIVFANNTLKESGKVLKKLIG